MSQLDLNKLLTFIPVSNPDGFADYDNCEGFNACLYVEGGIVTTNDIAKEYRGLVQQYEKRLRDIYGED